MKIHAYAICWNEQEFLPYYLRWYTSFCEKVIIYDNYSTDKSRQIIGSFSNTEIRLYNSNDRLNDQKYIDIKNNCWKESHADYVIVGDIDEILYHPYISKYLKSQKFYSIIETPAFEIISKKYPRQNSLIHRLLKYGAPRTLNREMNKKMIFDPSRIDEISYEKGCHRSNPQGDVKSLELEKSKIKLLHYKWLNPNHVWNRILQYRKRNILEDGKVNNATYHTITKKQVFEKFDSLWQRRKKII